MRRGRALLLGALASVLMAQAGRTEAAGPWSANGGTWVVANRIARQTAATVAGPKKYLLLDHQSSGDQSITALVRVDSFPHAESRAGVSLRTSPTTGDGYNFVVRPGQTVGFLVDGIQWGTTCAYGWTPGHWYWLKLSITGTNLVGRIWAKDQDEDQATTCQQAGWTHFSSGAPGLNGGSFGETISFDEVTVGAFEDNFDADGPALPADPPSGYLTRRQFLTQIQGVAQTESFDLGGFVNLLHATAYQLVCANNPAGCQNYASGFAVSPSPFYNGGTWMRDSTWTLAGLNDADLFAAQTSAFATAGTSEGRIATLLINSAPGPAQPWYGAGGQGNPLPDDDSNLMYAIAARLGWRPVTNLEFLNQVYAWIRTHAAADGTYPTTSHGWHDSFYPVGTSGPSSVTVASNMQGLYAVALRALKDLGVDVPQSEIDAAGAQYAALTVNGRLRAFRDADLVNVSGLMGEALSLYIWNQPMLSDSVVQQTIASFAEVFDAQSRFVGYKVISEANGGFLPPTLFPVENGGAGTKGGDYQNGGSWLLYDALALYAGVRHALPVQRDAYTTRLVQRFASELRAGVGTTPANKSNEFLCTAAGTPDDSCGPTGSAVPERADYGWNAFIVRLLSDEDPPPPATTPPSECPTVPPGGSSTCPVPLVSPATLLFAAVKAGAGGAITAVTPAQVVTVQMPGQTGNWTAASDQPWLQVTGGAGSGAGQVSLAIVNPSNVIGAASSLAATLTITPASTTVSPVAMTVQLSINQTGGGTQPPLGQVDTPSQSASGVVGAIGVTGWVVDDVGVSTVKVYRGCVLASEPANCQGDVLPGASLVYIGDAVFVSGARPDVEALFSTYPARHRAGWGFAVLTNLLPRTTGTFASTGGHGPMTFYAVATDVEGNRRLLGRAYSDPVAVPTSVTLNNDNIAKPFGTLDTPAQGGTVSGNLISYGWALTPDADTVAGPGDILVPTNGSTMVVFVDGMVLGAVAYNQCRGTVGNPVPIGAYCDDDIASAFGHATPQPTFTTRTSNATRYRNLDAGRAAIAAFTLDTRTLSNGLHSIAWSVTDSAGRVEGIGSRQFTVLNGTSDVRRD